MNTVLIGYRGSGKTSLGKLLAQHLHRPFVDTDERITTAAQKSIKDIFATEGEPAFRSRESAAILEVAQQDNQIISLGGGAVLNPQNITALKPRSQIIFLQAPAEILHARISADAATAANRPSLTPLAGSLQEVQTLLAKRTPLYLAAADITLDVSHLSPAQALEKLLPLLKL